MTHSTSTNATPQKVFIDGQSGTTGLQIDRLLACHEHIEILRIPDSDRKDPEAKQAFLNDADIVVLCLPDDAARETASQCRDTTRILDASTAHRVDPAWTYGLPELTQDRRQKIADANRVSNPGCWPTGFLLAVKPLEAEGLLPTEKTLSVNGISGYSGGGRQMIERYETRASDAPNDLWYSRPYRLSFGHKHLAEMQKQCNLAKPPLFMPSVGHFAQGMLVNIPVDATLLNQAAGAADIQLLLAQQYEDEAFVRVHVLNDEKALEDGFLDPQGNNGTNRIDLFVFGDDEQVLLTARLDNLGKGASGAAVQNLNIMLALDEMAGLTV
mgnify:FL=1